MKTYSIYVLKDPRDGNIRYVGKTYRIAYRFRQHLTDKSKCHKVNWIRQLKSENLLPEMEVLVEGLLSEEVAFLEERRIISELRSTGLSLTNGTDGGEGASGATVSQETRDKIASAATGRIFSEEHRKKLSDIAKKREFSAATRARLAAAGRKRKFSKVDREKLSNAQKTSWLTRDRSSIAARYKGKHLPPETRAKLSAASVGRILSTETRSKISLAGRAVVHTPAASLIMDSSRRGWERTAAVRSKMSESQKLAWIVRREKEAKVAVDR